MDLCTCGQRTVRNDKSKPGTGLLFRYDGYVFGNTSVYCPWNVTGYVAALLKNRKAKMKNYWKNTSQYGILLTFVERTDFDVSDKFVQKKWEDGRSKGHSFPNPF